MADDDETQQLPKISKELMKEALKEILDEIPAFRAFAQRSVNESTSGGTETRPPGGQAKNEQGKDRGDHARNRAYRRGSDCAATRGREGKGGGEEVVI